MLGVRGGVSTLLKQQTPFLVANHCIAHHLALACGQAANEIPYSKRFIGSIACYYENSSVRTAGFESHTRSFE